MTSWPKLDDKLLADAAATFNWRLVAPAPLALTRDGAVLFRRTPPRDFASDLYELLPDGTVRTLVTAADLLGASEEHLSDAEKARRERTRTATRGVVDIDVSEDGRTVMVCYDYQSAKSIPIPDAARAELERLKAEAAAGA